MYSKNFKLPKMFGGEEDRKSRVRCKGFLQGHRNHPIHGNIMGEGRSKKGRTEGNREKVLSIWEKDWDVQGERPTAGQIFAEGES